MIYAFKRDKKAALLAEQERERNVEVRAALFEMNKYLRILADHYSEEVSDRQMHTLIDGGIEHLKLRIGADIIKIMFHNNIHETPGMEDKTRAFIKNAFENTRLQFKDFRYKGISLDYYIPGQYQGHVIEWIVPLVMKDRTSHRDGMRDFNSFISYLMTKFIKMKNEMYSEVYKSNKIKNE